MVAAAEQDEVLELRFATMNPMAQMVSVCSTVAAAGEAAAAIAFFQCSAQGVVDTAGLTAEVENAALGVVQHDDCGCIAEDALQSAGIQGWPIVHVKPTVYGEPRSVLFRRERLGIFSWERRCRSAGRVGRRAVGSEHVGRDVDEDGMKVGAARGAVTVLKEGFGHCHQGVRVARPISSRGEPLRRRVEASSRASSARGVSCARVGCDRVGAHRCRRGVFRGSLFKRRSVLTGL
jgi:hypothetical protein